MFKNSILVRKVILLSIVFALIFTLLPGKFAGNIVTSADENIPNSPVENTQQEQEERSEVIEKRTEKSKTFLNTDDTFTVEVFEKPIHFKEEVSSDWETIDNTLVTNENSDEYVNKANSLVTEFSEQASEDGELVKIEDEETSISLTAVGETSPLPPSFQNELSPTEGITQANEIVYPDLYPNVDVKYTVGTDRVKEDLILKEKPKSDVPTSFSFAINLEGLEYEKQEDDRISFTNTKTGEPAFYLEKPFMYDSFEPEGYKKSPYTTSFAEGSLSYDVEMELEQRDNQLYVDIIPNREWLDSENRVYPVVIDPTIVKIQKKPNVLDTNIRSHFPNDTGGAETTLGVGLYQSATQTNKIRSLLKFDLTSIPVGSKVLDATLNMSLASVWNDTPIEVNVHQVTSPWTESGATWQKKDSVVNWNTAGGDINTQPLATNWVDSLFDLSVPTQFILPDQTVQNWINQPVNNNGIMLKAKNETIKSWKKFYSSDDVQVGKYNYGPQLAITYASASRIGYESYWTYDEHEVAGGKVAVNVGTGNGVAHFNDLQIEGRGNSSMSFERFYNTKSTETNSLGLGWTHTGSESITRKGDDAYYTDRDGTTHEFVYNPTTKKYTGPPGIYLDLEYKSSPLIYEMRYQLRDKSGNLSQFAVQKNDYDTNALVFKLEFHQDRNGNKIQYAYNSKGDITSVTDASGRVMTITQGTSGISSVDFAGKKYTYHYNTGGQLSEVREYTSATNYLSTHYKYNSDKRLETITDPNGNQTKITYQAELIKSIQQPSPTGTALAMNSYTFDIPKRISEKTDPKGGVTKFTLNTNYGVKTSSNPLGKSVSQDTMDANFNTTQTTDAEGHITKSGFDPKGNLLNATDAKGVSTTNTYDSFSGLKTATNSKGTTSMDYDPKGNLEKMTEADGNITNQAYDIYGNNRSTTSSDGTQRLYAFDTSGNYQQSGSDQIGRIKSSQSDSFGNVLNRTNAKGNVTSYEYDQRLLLRKVTDGSGRISTYEYDGNENMLSAVNALGRTTSYTYNGQNQLKTRTLPLGQVTSFEYDQNGNLFNLRKANGSILKNEYDKANQLLWTYGDGTKKWGFTYDGNGNVKTTTDIVNGQVKTFVYDQNGNLDLETKGNTSIDYGYSEANEMDTIIGKSNQTSFTQKFNFNEVGKLREIHRASTKLVSFEYKPVGLPESVLFSNGVKTSFGFDEAQQLEILSVQRGTTALLTEAFKHDANGNIDNITSSAGNRAYTYDALNQLKSQTLAGGTVESYDYDKVGNRLNKKTTVNGQTTTTQYGHDANNRLTSVSGKSFVYDANGNRTKDGRFIYEYNSFDELQTVKTLAGQLVSSYEYDEQGRRISKKINGVKTNYHYGQGIEVLFETNAAGDITAEYTYDQRGFPKTLTKSGQTYFYVLNGHSDVVALTNATGQIVASYSYDAWGNILSQSGAMAKENPYRYAGYRFDEETSHYYLIARYYNADEGIFLSSDPVSGDATNLQSQNGYNYANNNPVMNYDPNGNVALAVSAAAGALFAVVQYLLDLGIKHGSNNIVENIDVPTLIFKGATGGAFGAIGGYGFSKAGLVGVEKAFVGLHLLPATYALSTPIKEYSPGGLVESAVFSILGDEISTTYKAIQNIIADAMR